MYTVTISLYVKTDLYSMLVVRTEITEILIEEHSLFVNFWFGRVELQDNIEIVEMLFLFFMFL